jgi:hypothetical protein
MARQKGRTVWVLDTETKGTGAEMVPLEKLERDRSPQEPRVRTTVLRRDGRQTSPEAEPAPAEQAPRRFHVESVMTGQVLADDVGARHAVEALRSVESVIDVRIDVWDAAEEGWRPLTLAEKKLLWAFRDV